MSTKLYDSQIERKFKESLILGGASSVTIKNYLSDIRQFLRWRENTESRYLEDAQIIGQFIDEFESKLSTSSLKRKASAIKKYLISQKDYNSTGKGNIFKANFVPILSSVSLLILIALLLNTRSDVATIKDTALTSADYRVNNNSRIYDFSESDAKILLSSDSPEGEAESDTLLLEASPAYENVPSDQGAATIAKGERQVLIINELVNPESFIYLTPKGQTGNQVPYTESQGEGYMVVAVEDTVAHDIELQWKVDNTEVYSLDKTY